MNNFFLNNFSDVKINENIDQDLLFTLNEIFPEIELEKIKLIISKFIKEDSEFIFDYISSNQEELKNMVINSENIEELPLYEQLGFSELDFINLLTEYNNDIERVYDYMIDKSLEKANVHELSINTVESISTGKVSDIDFICSIFSDKKLNKRNVKRIYNKYDKDINACIDYFNREFNKKDFVSDSDSDDETIPVKRPYNTSSDEKSYCYIFDGHGKSLEELQNFLEELKFLKRNYRNVEVITGKGLHSKDNIPILKPYLLKYLRKNKIPYEVKRSGGSIFFSIE